jgi:hypothetical protein
MLAAVLHQSPELLSTETRPHSAGSETAPKRPRLLNPFRIPENRALFKIREDQRQHRELERHSMEDARLYICQPDRENFRKLTALDPPRISAEEDALAQLILSPDSNEATEGLRDFIDQKREIFLAQLAIETKREELQRLERLEREEQENLTQKEGELSLFQDQFRAFLDDDQRSLADARRAAETKARQRDEISTRIRQISSQNSSLRNEIAASEEKLQECESFRAFMEGLTPVDWRRQHPLPELFFKTPGQMLTILQSLEEQNMFLIQHCQDAEDALERTKAVFNRMLDDRDDTITEKFVKRDRTQRLLEDRNAQVEQFKGVGGFRHGNEIPEPELVELSMAIGDFYATLGFDTAATGDVPMMLKKLEDRMMDLFIVLEEMDEGLVRETFLERVRKRRDRERAEKAAQKQKEQDEKILRALQLATMPIKRIVGRPLVPRSCLAQSLSREKREEQLRLMEAEREADQDLLFGPIWD